MRPSMMQRSLVCLLAAVVIVGLGAGFSPAGAAATQALVSVGSPTNQHPQNSQNEPALAVDASRPDVLAAGANDLVDMQPCSRQAATTAAACSFPLGTFNLGVGLDGIYFSFDRGHTWTQPTYTGLTAADCSPTVEPCTPHVGPIHTVPNYFEAGLRSRGDPAVAFGPVPVNGKFSWANGSRLYAANLATNLTDTLIGAPFNSSFAVTVSHIDNVTPDRIQTQANWSRPALVAPRSAATAGLDKEQVWADNAASSPFFGHAYVCYTDFHSLSGGVGFPLFPFVASSTDGGVTWTNRRVAPPVANFVHGNRQGCTVRTDSHGVVYAFFTHFAVGTPGIGTHTMIKSFNGGNTWTPPVEILSMNDACFIVDPVSGRCVADGIAGARTDLAAMPSVDIANGAPTGQGATNELNEKTLLSFSTNGGATWSAPSVVSEEGDRSVYSAPAISPNGRTVYVVYMAFRAPFQNTTANPRPERGVLRVATIGANGAPGAFVTASSGPTGDARGTSQGRILYNEFLGDYVYAIATNSYGAGTWTDVRRTADCPAMDTWRQASFDAGHQVFPAPWPLGDCPPAFGNNDIFSATTG
jgi:hypothetical protein